MVDSATWIIFWLPGFSQKLERVYGFRQWSYRYCSFLVKDPKIDNAHYSISLPWLKRLDSIAQYLNGRVDKEVFLYFDPMIDMLSATAIIAKDINTNNESDYLFSYSPLITKNLFEIKKMTALQEDQKTIISFIESSKIQESEVIKQVFKNNTAGIKSQIDINYLNKQKGDFSIDHLFQFFSANAPIFQKTIYSTCSWSAQMMKKSCRMPRFPTEQPYQTYQSGPKMPLIPWRKSSNRSPRLCYI